MYLTAGDGSDGFTRPEVESDWMVAYDEYKSWREGG